MALTSQTEGTKHDGAKTRYELLPPELLDGIAQILTFGANKYADHNWAKGIKYSRCFGALMRHMWAWWRGEDLDAETGKSHLWHAGCELAFLIAFETRKQTHLDDRYVPQAGNNILQLRPPISTAGGAALSDEAQQSLSGRPPGSLVLEAERPLGGIQVHGPAEAPNYTGASDPLSPPKGVVGP